MFQTLLLSVFRTLQVFFVLHFLSYR